MQDVPLAGFDRETAAFALQQYKLRGIRYHGQASPAAVCRGNDGKLAVRVEPYKRGDDPFTIAGVDQVPCASPKKKPIPSAKALASCLLLLWRTVSACMMLAA
jgi:hypothetical protein